MEQWASCLDSPSGLAIWTRHLDSPPGLGHSEELVSDLTAELLLEHTDWVRRLAYRLVHDADSAEEVIQRTWLAALERPPKHTRNVEGWLGRVVTNTARKLGRDRSRRARYESRPRDAAGTTPSAAELYDRALLHRRLVDAVIGLPESYREVILMRFFDDRDARGIAEQLGLPLETVRTRIKRGLNRLHTALGDEADSRVLLPILAIPSTGATTTSLTTTSLGVLLMSTKVQVITAAVIVMVALGVWWPRSTDAPPDVASQPPVQHDTAGSSVASHATDRAARSPQGSTPSTDRANAESTDPASSNPFVIDGQVVDIDGHPVFGAHVFIADASQVSGIENERRIASLVAGWVNADSSDTSNADVRRTTTDGQGRFRIDGLSVGSAWAIAAAHSESGLGHSAGIALTEAEPIATQHVQLGGGVVIEGSVVASSTGLPIGNAYVGVDGFRTNEKGQRVGTNVASLRTDENGEFRFFPLPYTSYSVSVLAKSFQRTADQSISVGERTRYRLDFELTEAPVITGAIVDHSGQPANLARHLAGYLATSPLAILDLRACVSRRKLTQSDSSAVDTMERGQIDLENDRYRIELGSGGTQFVSIWFKTTLLGGADVHPGANDQDMPIDVSLIPAPADRITVRLTVLDFDTRSVISDFGFRVHEQPHGFRGFGGRSWGRQLPSDPRDKFELTAGSSVRTVVTAPGYADETVDLGFAGKTRVEDVEILLRRATATVSGVVTRDDGQASGNTKVYLYDLDSKSTSHRASATTDRDGKYTLTNVPNAQYWLVAEVEERVPAGEHFWLEGSAEIDLAIEDGVLVSLRVSGASGGFATSVTDADGRLIYDDNRNGARSHGGASYVLSAGESYTILIAGPDVLPVQRIVTVEEEMKSISVTLQSQ